LARAVVVCIYFHGLSWCASGEPCSRLAQINLLKEKRRRDVEQRTIEDEEISKQIGPEREARPPDERKPDYQERQAE